MSDDEPTRSELEKYARQVGLANLTPEQVDELVRADKVARDLRVALLRDFAVADEPAVTFRASDQP